MKLKNERKYLKFCGIILGTQIFYEFQVDIIY